MDNDIPLPSPPRNNSSARNTPRSDTVTNGRTVSNSRAHRLSIDRLGATPSSDPPLFSSDDFQSSALENYTSHPQDSGYRQQQPSLRKRRYRGTWWGEQVRAKKKRTEFKDKRNFDSGVWLGSEDSTDVLASSDDSGFLLNVDGSQGGQANGKQLGVAGDGLATGGYTQIAPRVSSEEDPSRVTSVEKAVEPESLRRARAAIIRCLEDGNDNVDLSYFNMETIPSGLLRSLVQLTKEPAVNEPPLVDDAYSPLEPFLRLFLTRNLLTSLPGEVFELEPLRVLSLRHNKLTEIPSAIWNLAMLQDLNVAGNRLNYLPWEVLHLIEEGDLRQLTVHPNPFIELFERDIEHWHCQVQRQDSEEPVNIKEGLKASLYEDEVPQEAWRPIHVATSKVQYLDMEGRPMQQTGSTQTKQQRGHDKLFAKCDFATAPSLRELSLRACVRSPQLSRLFDPDEQDSLACFPDSVLRLVDAAKRAKDAGGQLCSACSRPFVITRAQWVEWWDCIPFENGSKIPRKSGQALYPLPFLRKVCCWSCAPNC